MPIVVPCRLACLTAAFVSLICACSSRAHAGAWTLPEGNWQIVSMTIVSNADKSFDKNSRADVPVSFHKIFSSAYAEYGWNDWLTLIADPEYADATSAAIGRPTQKAADFAFSGGGRARLFDDFGVVSVQALARTAGAYELDTSVDQKPGEDFELRVLYGTHFKLFGRDGCLDLQIAQRWTTGGRPNETPIDVTAMYDVGWKSQVLLQSFNAIAQGSGAPSFSHYRYHKVALSVLRPVWGRTSLQIGGFVSPAGQNALEERGFFLGLWTRF